MKTFDELQREFNRLCEQCDLHDGISRGLLYAWNVVCTNHGAESDAAIALWEQMERNNREWSGVLAAKNEVFAQMYPKASDAGDPKCDGSAPIPSDDGMVYGSCPECGALQHAYSGYENDLCAHCEGIDYAIPDCEVLEVSDYVELIGDRTCDDPKPLQSQTKLLPARIKRDKAIKRMALLYRDHALQRFDTTWVWDACRESRLLTRKKVVNDALTDANDHYGKNQIDDIPF